MNITIIWVRTQTQRLNDLPNFIQVCYQNQYYNTHFLTSCSVPSPFCFKSKYPPKSCIKTGVFGSHWTPSLVPIIIVGSSSFFFFKEEFSFAIMCSPRFICCSCAWNPTIKLQIIISIHSPVSPLRRIFTRITDKEAEAQRKQINQLNIPRLISGRAETRIF